MYNNPSSRDSSLGCGFLGCLGDLIGAFLVGVVGLIVISLGVALIAPVPAPAPTATPDVRLTVSESYLNRFVRTATTDESVQVDILPGGQFRFIVDTTVAVLGVSIPVQLTGLFDVQSTGQSLEARLLETQVADMTLPPELADFFAGSLSDVNNELNNAVSGMSTALGVPLNFVGVGSDANTFWLEAMVTP
jgi:hypothetical protein